MTTWVGDDRRSEPSLAAVFEKLGGMESKLDSALAGKADHETRLRSLERIRNMGAGILAVFGLPFLWSKLHG